MGTQALAVSEYIDYIRANRQTLPITLSNYAYASRKLGIEAIETASLPELWKRLSDLLDTDTANRQYNPEPSNRLTKRPLYYGYVKQFYQFARDMLNHYAIEVKPSVELNVFLDKLASKKHIPVGYNDAQVKLLLDASQSMMGQKDWGLYRLLLLLLYSGIRISAASNVRFTSFKPVDGVDDVLTFRVEGTGTKGHPYNAIISKHVVAEMQRYNPFQTDYITNHREGSNSTSFASYNRSQLAYTIIAKGLREKVSVNTSIFHSLRKTFMSKLARFSVEADNISLLAGQIPNTLAYKAYIQTPGKTDDDVTVRIARAYANSGMTKWKAWEVTA
jgi:integrase